MVDVTAVFLHLAQKTTQICVSIWEEANSWGIMIPTFSTYLQRWNSSHLVKFQSTLVDDNSDLCYQNVNPG